MLGMRRKGGAGDEDAGMRQVSQNGKEGHILFKVILISLAAHFIAQSLPIASPSFDPSISLPQMPSGIHTPAEDG